MDDDLLFRDGNQSTTCKILILKLSASSSQRPASWYGFLIVDPTDLKDLVPGTEYSNHLNNSMGIFLSSMIATDLPM